MGIFAPGINKGAYQGELTCPYIITVPDGTQVTCGSRAIRYVEHVTPTRMRYRCRRCGGAFQYDISNRHDLNPYAPFRKGKIWRNIEKVLIAQKAMGGSSKGVIS